MFIQRAFSPQNVLESEVYGFDFDRDLGTDTISAIVSWTISVKSGTDATASTHLISTAAASGTVVSQRVSGLNANVIYTMEATIQTSGSNTIVLTADAPGA